MRWHLLLVLLVLAACQEQTPTYPARVVPTDLFMDADVVRAGRELFQQKCASCHGHSYEGRSLRAVFFDPPAPTFSEPRYRSVDPAYLFWRIEQGKAVEPFSSRGSVMPSWGGLSLRRSDLAARCLSSLAGGWKKALKPRQSHMTAWRHAPGAETSSLPIGFAEPA
ncbi:cbb3-type cytochrome c oxidase subunit III [Geothermobacter ehrlichii]|uniref:Cbb3-type cytochrome c oxidase subunit III n=1 Tax=Geothermobacter ehrlichii TaxID=213224 RepID=A0A5D3WMB6_9BACT|nr:cytochrome c [Geothermobacter ehrlichii]TYO99343.1 cbb3-type cytochrome c oxidase subunit III [Geothermobacter ehrlichii]